MDESRSLTLDSIRSALIRQEDSIIFGLLERAQYCYNADTYDHDAFFMEGFNGSLVEYMVLQTEQLHAQVIAIFEAMKIWKTKKKIHNLTVSAWLPFEIRWEDTRAQMSMLSSLCTYLSQCFHPCSTRRF